MNRQEIIEFLHDSGKMPDEYYYQVNGKSFQENYTEIRRKQQKRSQELIYEEREARRQKALEARKEKEFEAELDKQVEEKVGAAVEAAIEKAFEKLL